MLACLQYVASRTDFELGVASVEWTALKKHDMRILKTSDVSL